MDETRLYFRSDLNMWHMLDEHGFTLKEKVATEVLLANAWARMEDPEKENLTQETLNDTDNLDESSIEIEDMHNTEEVLAAMAIWISSLNATTVPGITLNTASDTITIMSISGMWIIATCALRILAEAEDTTLHIEEYADDLQQLSVAMWLLEAAYDPTEGVQLTLNQMLDIARHQGRLDQEDEQQARPYKATFDNKTTLATMYHPPTHTNKLNLILNNNGNSSILKYNNVVTKILNGELELQTNTDNERGWRLVGALEAMSAFNVVKNKNNTETLEVRKLGLMAALPENIINNILKENDTIETCPKCHNPQNCKNC